MSTRQRGDGARSDGGARTRDVGTDSSLAVVTGFGAKGIGRGVEAGLEDEDVLLAHGFADGDGRFVVAELFDGALGEGDAEPV